MAAASDDLPTVAETNQSRRDMLPILGLGIGEGMEQHSDEYGIAVLHLR